MTALKKINEALTAKKPHIHFAESIADQIYQDYPKLTVEVCKIISERLGDIHNEISKRHTT